jgi:ABC-type lipoprotein export system ATPase subunit
MATLLSFANVGKCYPDGGRHVTVLDGVTFELDPGVFAGVYGARRSGKSTLLRLAAGIERPDRGTIRVNGRALNAMSVHARGRLLRTDLALMASSDWRPSAGESVVDHVVTALGSSGLTVRESRRRARAMLERVGMCATSADEPAGSLSLSERTLVMLARGFVREPGLLLVDEPAVMPSLSDREGFYALLRELARERGAALLVASQEIGALLGADVMMSLAAGEVTGATAERARVVQLRPRGGGMGRALP